MDVVGYGVRIGVASGTRVVRLSALGEGPRAEGKDGLVSSLPDGQGGVGNQLLLIEDGVPTFQPVAPGASDAGGLTLTPDPGCADPFWRIEHEDVTCRWLPALHVVAPPYPDQGWSAIDLKLPRSEAGMHARGPYVGWGELPDPRELVLPGHDLVDVDTGDRPLWVEVTTETESGGRVRMRQRFAHVGGDRYMLIVAEAPEGAHQLVWAVQDELAHAFSDLAAPERPGAGADAPGPVPRSWWGARRG